MFLEECSKCGKVLNENTPCRGFAHTDVFWCEECFKDNQPDSSKREDSVLHTIPEWGSKSSLNFDEWQRRCGARNIVEIQ